MCHKHTMVVALRACGFSDGLLKWVTSTNLINWPQQDSVLKNCIVAEHCNYTRSFWAPWLPLARSRVPEMDQVRRLHCTVSDFEVNANADCFSTSNFKVKAHANCSLAVVGVLSFRESIIVHQDVQIPGKGEQPQRLKPTQWGMLGVVRKRGRCFFWICTNFVEVKLCFLDNVCNFLWIFKECCCQISKSATKRGL